MTTKPQTFRTLTDAKKAIRIMMGQGWSEVRTRGFLHAEGFKVVGRSPDGNSGAFCEDGLPHTNFALLGFTGRD